MNKEQRTYVVQQVRAHAKWLLENAALVKPIEPSESDVAYALVDAGFEVVGRPITEVALPPTEQHKANLAEFEAYMNKMNELVAAVTVDVLDNAKDGDPAYILNTFITDAAKIPFGK